jgi:hypothetical protein
MRAAPSSVAVFRPGPGPVKARDEGDVVTACVVEDPPDPPVLGGCVVGGVVGWVVGEGVVDDVTGPVVVEVAAAVGEVVDGVADTGAVVEEDASGVVVVEFGPPVVVVGVVPPLALAMTGSMELTTGESVVMPEGTTESLGYDWHVKVRELPARVRESPALESC